MDTTIAPRRLFDISADLQALEDLLYESGGDITDEDVEAALDQWFETLAVERDQKLDNYAALIKELEARSSARRREGYRLNERAKVDANIAARLNDRLLYFFRVHDLKSIETTRYRLTRAKAGGKVPVVVKVPDDELPEAFKRVSVSVSADKDAIREALENGEELEFAELGERSQYMRIS